MRTLPVFLVGFGFAASVGCNNDAPKPTEVAPPTDATATKKEEPPKPAEETTSGPIKVGILHSLSGTMAISETSLKDVALMTIEQINAKGGVLGRKLEPVVIDPASNWPLFAEKARELLQKDKVSVVFGCWTSVSRKSVLPVFEELNGLLFYPVQYEGEESSYNVFYTGAAPNQQAIPAVEYMMSEKGGGAKRFELLGTDYVYPRTTNKILRYFLHSKGVSDDDIHEEYTPFGHNDYQTIVAGIKKFATGKRTAVISTRSWPTKVSRRGTFLSSPFRSARRNCAASIPSPSSATWRRGIISCRSIPRRTRRSFKRGATT
jgi:ABC-type branched-subunit amino acid transport system substrate-binding protein